MKEATGELSMTVIVILAVVAIAGILAVLRGPLTNFINDTFHQQATEVINNAK